MKNGYRIVDPSFRPRLPELEVYRGPEEIRNVRDRLRVGTINYDRFAGTAPTEGDTKVTPGGRTANERPERIAGGRMAPSPGGHHRVSPQPGVESGNVEGRLQDMDLEGRDVDFLYPSGWTSACIGIPDVSLTEGIYRAFNNFYRDYCSQQPDRLKGLIQVPCSDVEWAVAEVKAFANDKWVAGVQPQLPEGMPVDHPDLDPLWEVMNDLDLPYAHHSIFFEPPYWPGYRIYRAFNNFYRDYCSQQPDRLKGLIQVPLHEDVVQVPTLTIQRRGVGCGRGQGLCHQ